MGKNKTITFFVVSTLPADIAITFFVITSLPEVVYVSPSVQV